ncbi:hypothetical protein KOW79_000306 [Hemibagrus wyckioides]|uniref:Uncharacterized protein n=1 Tax=Hemibagrus wyckioides TaxID=337641 RepID=A0A9D3SYF7_9TELE|nr:hypothetical protein KOW79_000306 [Hemibagrus wyckioides]
MLVKNQKYVKVAKTEEGYEDFNTFLQKVIEKLGLPLQSELRLADESGTEVDADVFEELLQAGNLTVTVSTEQSIEWTWLFGLEAKDRLAQHFSSVPEILHRHYRSR